MKYVNLAFYHFFRTPELEGWRVQLKEMTARLEFKGSILISPEGINVMISGTPEGITEFKTYLIELINEDSLMFKESHSDYPPFKRMLVKIKDQIIPVNDPDIKPRDFTGPRIGPEKFKAWLDENKDIIVLDARNNFEFDLGTFENAKPIDIKHFRDFERKVTELPEDWKDKIIVTFCTGGVRCEKATPVMMKAGFKNVYQLDGGILNYFEKVGSEHYKGDCFVFDERVALDSELNETKIKKCYNCRSTVSEEEQKLPTYHYGVSCPHCYSPDGNHVARN